MNIRFRPLFTLGVSHTFYTNRCLDFRFVYPEDTNRWLRNARVIAKEKDGVLHMLYEADVDGTPLVPIPGMTLRIGLQLVNPYFTNITQLPAAFPGQRLRYTNATTPTALDAVTTIPFRAPTFNHVLTDAARPVTVTLSNQSGALLQTDIVTAADQRTAVSFDVSREPTGVLNVAEAFPASTNTVSYYIDGELQQLDAAAVVEVTVAPGFYTTPPAFDVAFQTRADTLRYYVVASRYSAADVDLLSVTDQGFTEDGRSEITFTKIAPADFAADDLSPSLVSPGGDMLVLFKSDSALARQERARKRIQLSKNGDPLIQNLPQPGADRAKGELIIHLSKP